MAHFAELDENNKVVQVIVVDELTASDEQKAIDFLFDHYGHKNWVQTWKGNGLENPRKFFAGIGYTYDKDRDAFIAPKPEGFDSWIFNEVTCAWEAPVPKPDIKEKVFYWSEPEQSWIEETRIVLAYYINEDGVVVWR